MASTHQRNSLEEFLEERRLSSFHFLLPFFSGLMFNSSHLSRVEQMVTVDQRTQDKSGKPESEPASTGILGKRGKKKKKLADKKHQVSAAYSPGKQ